MGKGERLVAKFVIHLRVVRGLASPVGQNERKCNNYRNLSQFLELISPGGGSNLVRGDNPAASVASPAFNNYFIRGLTHRVSPPHVRDLEMWIVSTKVNKR